MNPADFDSWIVHKLQSDTQITNIVGTRMYNTEIPHGSAFPVILFVPNSFTELGAPGPPWATRALYLIKAVAPVPSVTQSVLTLSQRLDALFDSVSEEWNGIWYCSWKDSSVELSEDRAGQVWRHLGGMYWLLGVPS